METKKVTSSLLLMLTALIWGIAFVAQQAGMEYVGPFTFNGVRSIIGAVTLLPLIAFRGYKQQRTGLKPVEESRKTLWTGGLCCGVALFAASNFQQFGLQFTTVGKSGFLTALYIVIVPVLGLFSKKRLGLPVWVSVALALAGIYLLCMTSERFALTKGDTLVLICAFLFSIHILVIDRFAGRCDSVKMSCIQFFVCGLLSMICMFLFETPSFHAIGQAYISILYAGALSCGVAYTLQIIGQRYVVPTVASLILSLESVFAVLAGWILLGQNMSMRETAGCLLVFIAIILAQLPEKFYKKFKIVSRPVDTV